MGLQTLSFTATANTKLATVVRRHDQQSYAGTLFIKGGLGAGTFTLQVSPDGGTTKYTVKDTLGNNITGSATGVYFNYVFAGDSSKNSDDMILYVDLAGATNPTLTVYNYDNR